MKRVYVSLVFVFLVTIALRIPATDLSPRSDQSPTSDQLISGDDEFAMGFFYFGSEEQEGLVFPSFFIRKESIESSKQYESFYDGAGKVRRIAKEVFSSCGYESGIVTCPLQSGPPIFSDLHDIPVWFVDGDRFVTSALKWTADEDLVDPLGGLVPAHKISRCVGDSGARFGIATSKPIHVSESTLSETDSLLVITDDIDVELRKQWSESLAKFAMNLTQFAGRRGLVQLVDYLAADHDRKYRVTKLTNTSTEPRYIVYLDPNDSGFEPQNFDTTCGEKIELRAWLITNSKGIFEVHRPIYFCESGSEGGVRPLAMRHLSVAG